MPEITYLEGWKHILTAFIFSELIHKKDVDWTVWKCMIKKVRTIRTWVSGVVISSNFSNLTSVINLFIARKLIPCSTLGMYKLIQMDNNITAHETQSFI